MICNGHKATCKQTHEITNQKGCNSSDSILHEFGYRLLELDLLQILQTYMPDLFRHLSIEPNP